MNLDKNMFTKQQYVAILELYNYIYKCNNDVSSTCKIDGIQAYVDRHNDFFLAYAFHNASGGGLNSTAEYIMIDKYGKKIDLTKLYSEIEPIVRRLNKMTELNIK